MAEPTASDEAVNPEEDIIESGTEGTKHSAEVHMGLYQICIFPVVF